MRESHPVRCGFVERLLHPCSEQTRTDTNRCTVVIMWLAGIPVADKAVLRLAASLRKADSSGNGSKRADVPPRLHAPEAETVLLAATF